MRRKKRRGAKRWRIKDMRRRWRRRRGEEEGYKEKEEEEEEGEIIRCGVETWMSNLKQFIKAQSPWTDQSFFILSPKITSTLLTEATFRHVQRPIRIIRSSDPTRDGTLMEITLIMALIR